MNWQLISFFGDSTVLLPSAAALFIVLMLRKTSRLLAWQCFCRYAPPRQ